MQQILRSDQSTIHQLSIQFLNYFLNSIPFTYILYPPISPNPPKPSLFNPKICLNPIFWQAQHVSTRPSRNTKSMNKVTRGQTSRVTEITAKLKNHPISRSSHYFQPVPDSATLTNPPALFDHLLILLLDSLFVNYRLAINLCDWLLSGIWGDRLPLLLNQAFNKLQGLLFSFGKCDLFMRRTKLEPLV